MQIDQLNLIGLIGEPNPVYPESSFGTVSCSSGMSGFDSLFSGTTTACNVASNSGYPSNFYAYDDDEDSSSTDHIADAKFYFDLSLAEGTSIGAVHYAFNTVNQNSTITIAPQVRTYGIDGGWTNTPSDDDIVSTSASGKYYSS